MTTALIDALRPLLTSANRAPSAHNTQPWLLAASTDDRVRLSWDHDRWLTITDPDRRDLYLSCGAFIESMLIAASTRSVGVQFTSEISEQDLGWFANGPIYETAFTEDDLRSRRSHRLHYRDVPLDAASRAHLDDEIGDHETRLLAIPKSGLERTLRMADAHQLRDRHAARELRAWTRLTKRELAADDGLTAPCLGLSRAEAYSLAAVLGRPLDPLRGPLGLATLTARFGTPIDFHHTDVLTLVGKRDAFDADPLAHGRLLMRLWLRLHRDGYATHPLSQLIDVPESAATLGAQLELAPDERLLAIFRVGKPTEHSPVSPRRPGMLA